MNTDENGGNWQYDNQQYGDGISDQYNNQQYGGDVNIEFGGRQFGSLREQIPEGLMERLPEHLQDKVDDAIAGVEQKARNPYASVKPDVLETKMNTKLSIAALIIGFGGAIIFAKIDPVISMLCVGIMITIFGIGAVTGKNFSFHKHAMSALLPIIGISILLITGYLLLSKNISSLPKMEGKFRTIVIGVGMAGLGAAVLILNIIATHYLKKACSERIQARCVYIKEETEYSNGRRHIKRAPVFEFQFLGNTYCVSENSGSGKVPSIGESCEIFINPNNPKEFYRKGGNPMALFVIVCGVFILFGVLACCYA